MILNTNMNPSPRHLLAPTTLEGRKHTSMDLLTGVGSQKRNKHTLHYDLQNPHNDVFVFQCFLYLRSIASPPPLSLHLHPTVIANNEANAPTTLCAMQALRISSSSCGCLRKQPAHFGMQKETWNLGTTVFVLSRDTRWYCCPSLEDDFCHLPHRALH